MRPSESAIQARYYTHTAHAYHSMHVGSDDEHAVALRYMGALVDALDLRTVLDVGTGTGRAISYLQQHHPRVQAVGVEPVAALLTQAAQQADTPVDRLIRADGYHLPFADASFDATCEFGMLHHVKHPNEVVDEMMRVSRSAIFLSDSNRFGQGRLVARLAKLALASGGLWDAVAYLKNGGHTYTISEGDGLAYSYSVFDSFGRLGRWADRVICVPTMPAHPMNRFHPLLTAGHVLLCAIRERD